jgi:hypothetical protein
MAGESNPDLRKHLVAKAMVDPAFRTKLFEAPHEVFGHPPTETDLAGLQRLKRMLPALDDIVTSLAGEVLCGGGGGCGGLA